MGVLVDGLQIPVGYRNSRRRLFINWAPDFDFRRCLWPNKINAADQMNPDFVNEG